MPNLLFFHAFARILSDHAVARKALMGFQQFREFFHGALPHRVTDFAHESRLVGILLITGIVFPYESRLVWILLITGIVFPYESRLVWILLITGIVFL